MKNDPTDTSPQLPRPKRGERVQRESERPAALEPEALAETIPPDAGVPSDFEDLDLKGAVISFMSGVDKKFERGERRMEKHERQLKAFGDQLGEVRDDVRELTETVKSSLTKRDAFIMRCVVVGTVSAMICAGALVAFLVMRFAGPMQLGPWTPEATIIVLLAALIIAVCVHGHIAARTAEKTPKRKPE